MSSSMRIPLLDHGYLELIDSWGSEERIIEAARMSTDKGFLGWGPHHEANCSVHDPIVPSWLRLCTCTPKPGDERLLRYLWENEHATPFEMAGLTFEVQAPIFVFREWHRHRVPFGYNELSARYTPIPDVNYIPTLERCMLGGGHLTKQAGTIKDADQLTEETAHTWLVELEEFYDRAEELYQMGLRRGLPKELARLVVPVGRYSRMRATGNLRGWLGFVRLRAAPTAQWEIRQFAEAVGRCVGERFPRTWALFTEGRAK